MLVIAGAEDRMTPPSVVRRVAEKYRTVATYRQFDNHAHWLVAEPGWQEIAEFVMSWIEQFVPTEHP
jgi:pimeloyl-ACP methyl ester carboxylesterase